MIDKDNTTLIDGAGKKSDIEGGFNAASEEFEDLMKARIMDPTKVVA